MAGHSKWANIQHRKKAQDAKRGKLFTKLIREVSVAALGILGLFAVLDIGPFGMTCHREISF